MSIFSYSSVNALFYLEYFGDSFEVRLYFLFLHDDRSTLKWENTALDFQRNPALEELNTSSAEPPFLLLEASGIIKTRKLTDSVRACESKIANGLPEGTSYSWICLACTYFKKFN